MSFYTGSGCQVALGDESAWGVPVADSMLFNFSSESLKPAIEKKQEDNLLASKAAAAYDLTGVKVGGDLAGILKPENAGKLIKWALGGTDTVVPNFGSVTGQYQHTIIAAAAAGVLPSKTVMVNRKSAIKRYSGMKVDSMTIVAKSGDYVRVTLSLKGKDESTGTIITTTVPSLKAFKFINGTLMLGATAAEFTSATLKISNNLDDGIQTNLSAVYYTEPPHKTRSITLEVELPECALAETIRTTNRDAEALLSSCVFHLESPSIIASTAKYRIDATLNNVAVKDAPPPNVSGDGLLSSTISCEATAVGATEPISIAVYDATAAAY